MASGAALDGDAGLDGGGSSIGAVTAGGVLEDGCDTGSAETGGVPDDGPAGFGAAEQAAQIAITMANDLIRSG